MATGTDAGGTWNTTAGNKTVTATPAANDLIVVIHGISGWVSGDNSVITDNNSGGGGTYTRLGTAAAPLSSGGGTACALWISVRDSLISSASSTVFTATNTGDTGGGLTVLRFSGMSRVGSNAIKQSIGESSATENPPTITFGATTLTGNPIILACMGEDNPAALTPPTGFTEADDTGWATPTTGIEVCWDDSGNTSTLFSWSGGALTDHNEVGIELDASLPIAIQTLTAVSQTGTRDPSANLELTFTRDAGLTGSVHTLFFAVTKEGTSTLDASGVTVDGSSAGVRALTNSEIAQEPNWMQWFSVSDIGTGSHTITVGNTGGTDLSKGILGVVASVPAGSRAEAVDSLSQTNSVATGTNVSVTLSAALHDLVLAASCEGEVTANTSWSGTGTYTEFADQDGLSYNAGGAYQSITSAGSKTATVTSTNSPVNRLAISGIVVKTLTIRDMIGTGVIPLFR